MTIARLISITFTAGALAAAAVFFVEPEKRLSRPTMWAIVEVRVVPRFTPTAALLRSEVLSDAALRAVWQQLHSDANGESPDATITEWRSQLDAEIEPSFADDLRRVRISWNSAANPDEAAQVVQSLASRYAGQLAADRWYGSVDRLRIAEESVERSSRELIESIHLATTGNKSAKLSFSSPLNTEIVQVEAIDELTAPLLIAPKNSGVLVAERTETSDSVTTTATGARATVKTSDTPESTSTAAASPKLLEAEQQFTATIAELHRHMNEIILPRNAEFPVVATTVTGLNVWQSRATWNVLAALVGLLAGVLTTIVGQKLRLGTTSQFTPQETPTAAEVDADAALPLRHIDSLAAAERAAKAPVLGVIRRRAA